jgi:hypothetical protein
MVSVFLDAHEGQEVGVRPHWPGTQGSSADQTNQSDQVKGLGLGRNAPFKWMNCTGWAA